MRKKEISNVDGKMPVVTRSCTKQKRGPRIEDDTPATSNMVRSCRYVTRSTAKRKILQQDHEGKNLEPSSKRAACVRTSNYPSITGKNSATTNKNNTGGNIKSNECRARKNMPESTFEDNKRASSLSNTGCRSKENGNKRHENLGSSMSHVSGICSVEDSEPVTKTPADCMAARIRSYSALRRSQWRKNNNRQTVNRLENAAARSPLEELSCNPRAMEIDTDNDEDVLWKMSRQFCLGEKCNSEQPMVDDLESYKEKYFTLITAMKQLQNTFLRAQQNAEKNMKAYDRFSDQLKTSLSQEKQKTSLLNEELKIKKGIVERLRSDLENAKEHLEYLKQEKINIEKHSVEKSEKEITPSNKTHRENENSLLQVLEDQKRVINFYSKLSGVSISSDKACEDSSSFQSFNCNFYPSANAEHCLRFRLTHDQEFDEIEYSPNPGSPGSEEVLMDLPKYMQENIFFGSEEASRFLATLITTAKK